MQNANQQSPGASFRLKALTDAGLAGILPQIKSGLPLSFEAAQPLAKVPFPMLAALGELSPAHHGPGKIQPVLYAPLHALVTLERESDAVSFVSSEAAAFLDRAPGTVALAIDSWGSGETYRKILTLLEQLTQAGKGRLLVLGPTTAELKTISGMDPAALTADFFSEYFSAAFFADLRAAGVESIQGGTDLRLLRLAAENGLRVTVTQNIVRSRLRGTGEFLREIFDIRRELLQKPGMLETWSPWSSFVLDSGLPKGEIPLGLELLQCVCLAHLLLPEVPNIRAPLSLFGIHAAEVAAAFGANDFGYTAVQSETGEKLGLPPLSTVVAEFQASHTLTAAAGPLTYRKEEDRREAVI